MIIINRIRLIIKYKKMNNKRNKVKWNKIMLIKMKHKMIFNNKNEIDKI
jgi:hypothetical protein